MSVGSDWKSGVLRKLLAQTVDIMQLA